jgi:transcriptional regulator with XRE-family HTH domain
VGGEGKREVSVWVASMVGTNLARFRESRGLSQEEVANWAGLHRTEISLMELGKRTPRIDTIFRVIGALEIDAAEAFKGASWQPYFDKPGGEIKVDRNDPDRDGNDD